MTRETTRRAFLRQVLGAGAAVGLAARPLMSSDATGQPHVCAVPSELPFRQDDPVWSNDPMWDRPRVIEAHTRLNRRSRPEAEALLREFEDGNTIGNEGCLLTCLAMALRLLARPRPEGPWTPRVLNRMAHDLNYYTPAGVSMAPLYADLLCEVTEGEVQLCAKEEYLAGEPGWHKVYANTSALVRGYRSLGPNARRDFALVLKTGTYDDTVASHYVLLHPDSPDSADVADAELLDPAMPRDARGSWRLSDSARRITADPDIRRAWKRHGIEPLQIGGAWIFGRWRSPEDGLLMAPLLSAWAGELARRPRR